MSSPRRKAVAGYELQSQLGAGGQGEVWRAKGSDGQLVALKLLSLGFDEDRATELRRRVKREVQALSKVVHPAVVKALATGEESDHLFIAYELIDGQDVQAALRAPVPPSPDDCAALLLAIADGLDRVHAEDLIHRDIKPSNIVLRGGDWSAPVVVDFGYARPGDASKLTVTGLAVGTAGYLAPEVCHDPQRCSARSDQWSLARVVLEGLTVSLGMDLSDFTTHEEMLAACADAASSTSVVLKMAMTEPAHRFESIATFATAFRDALVDDGLVVEPEQSIADAPPRLRNEPLREYFTRIGCQVAKDLRPSGCLWILGDFELLRAVRQQLVQADIQLGFTESGGRATRHQPAWYTKATG